MMTDKTTTLFYIQKESILHVVPCQRTFGEALAAMTTDFEAEASVPIGNVKVKIRDMEGFPPGQQRPIFEGKQWVDRCALSDCNFQNESTFQTVLHLCGGMQIFVKMLTGKTITLD
eukprot:4409607-Karenia_brevis.AAC.1